MNDLEIYEMLQECSSNYEEINIYDDPIAFFGSDYMQESVDLMTEANTATVKNALLKMWKVIIAAFSSIGRMFSRLLKWIKKVFFEKNNVRSLDQIGLETLPFDSNSFYSYSGNDTKGSKSSNDGSFIGSNKQQIIVDSDPNSEMKLEPIEAAVKDIIVTFNKQKESIKFNIKRILKNSYMTYSDVKPNAKHGPIVGQASIGNNHIIAFRFINHPEAMDELVNIVSNLCDYVKDSSTPINPPELDEKLKRIHEISSSISTNVEFDITYREFEEFSNKVILINKKFAECNITTAKVDETNEHNMYGFILGRTYDSKLINVINDVSGIAFTLQMGINAITATIQQSFIIDLKFGETCDNINDLDKFISGCIKGGIPSKYIAYNAWIVMSKSLRGVSANKNKPVWGQSRVVFFPDKDPKYVYKVALNANGLFSNKTERIICKQAENGGDNIKGIFNYIANTTTLTANAAVAVMERAISNDKPDGMIIHNLANAVQGSNGILKNANFRIEDLHTGNARKMRDGKWKFIDYGMASLAKVNPR